jgi:hypothetical protein
MRERERICCAIAFVDAVFGRDLSFGQPIISSFGVSNSTVTANHYLIDYVGTFGVPTLVLL